MIDYSALDRTWRDIITTIPMVDNMPEFLILKYIVLHPEVWPRYREYPLIFAWELPLDPQRTDAGKVDLVLTDGQGKFLLVEVKYISPKPGKTARTKRNKNRKKGAEQASSFKTQFQQLHPEWHVDAETVTNDQIWSEAYEQFVTAEWTRIETELQAPVPSEYSQNTPLIDVVNAGMRRRQKHYKAPPESNE